MESFWNLRYSGSTLAGSTRIGKFACSPVASLTSVGSYTTESPPIPCRRILGSEIALLVPFAIIARPTSASRSAYTSIKALIFPGSMDVGTFLQLHFARSTARRFTASSTRCIPRVALTSLNVANASTMVAARSPMLVASPIHSRFKTSPGQGTGRKMDNPYPLRPWGLENAIFSCRKRATHPK